MVLLARIRQERRQEFFKIEKFMFKAMMTYFKNSCFLVESACTRDGCAVLYFAVPCHATTPYRFS